MTATLAGRTVFVCRDRLTGPIVDRIAADLSALGAEVVRGPLPPEGVRYDYPAALHAELFGRAEVIMVSLGSLATREIMLAAPRLRGIVGPVAGLETVDQAAADELGLVVANGAVRENWLGTAEATVMLILALSYQLHRTEQVLRAGLPRPRQDQSWARLLAGRSVGLVGFGNVGRAVASLLAPFGVELLASHPRLGQADMPAGVRHVALDELLGTADFVSLHASLNPRTRGMIGARELGLMKREAYLINTARGALVDEAALAAALRERRIAGAALDTFVVEPLPGDSPLRELDNVILTPHLVGITLEAYGAVVRAALDNIRAILAGEPPPYCRNPQVLPRWRERLARIAS